MENENLPHLKDILKKVSHIVICDDINGVHSNNFLELTEATSTGVKSNGIYSVMDDKWIKEPVHADIPDLDEDAFNEEFSKWEKKYFELLDKIG